MMRLAAAILERAGRTFTLATAVILISVIVAAGAGAATRSAPASTATPASNVSGLGVNVDPVVIGTDSTTKAPYGTALVNDMAAAGVKIVRLAYAQETGPTMYDASILAQNNGWNTVFSRLNAAGIKAVLILQQTLSSDPPANGVSAGKITNMSALLASEEGLLSTIRSQNGGSLPSNLVGLDVFNEPVLNKQTLPSLQTLANTIRSYANLPVFIGGWMPAGASQAGLACKVGDLVSPHIYVGGTDGAGTPALDPSTPAIRGLTNGFTAVSSPSFSPPFGSVIYAEFVSNGPDIGTPQSLNSITNTGTGLTWHLLKRSNSQAPGALGGTAEVWWAYNATAQSNIQVTAQLAVPAGSGNPDGYLQTLVYDNAAPDQSSAAAVAASSASPAAVPRATLTTTKPDSWVRGAVANWTSSAVGAPGSGQSLSSQSRNSTTGKAWWTQLQTAATASSGTNVTINDTAPSAAYNMVAFEVLGGPITDPSAFQTATASYLGSMVQAMQSARCSSTPVFVSELGASSGVPTSSAGSAAHQEAVIDGTLKALKAETAVPMNGAIPWIMSPMYVQSSNGFGLVDWNPSYWSPALADLHAYVFPN